MPTAEPDGERILTWQQIYTLTELPEKLVVVGSGVTGAELAHAYTGLGVPVTLVSSRDRVLPGEDADAAAVIEQVFRDDGMEVLGRSRMASVERTATGVRVTLVDGRTVDGSHALLAVGSVPQTTGLGLAEAGVELSESGHVVVDGVSRTSVRGVYAAGDCTGVLPLASVAAMQGRIAMWHALGDAVTPLRLNLVSANVFTSPEIATVGVSQRQIDDGEVEADVNLLPLATNPRAKMDSFQHGFVKVFLPQGLRHRRGRRRRRAAGVRADLPDHHGRAEPSQRRPGRLDLHGLPVDVGLDRRGGPPPALGDLTTARRTAARARQSRLRSGSFSGVYVVVSSQPSSRAQRSRRSRERWSRSRL